MISPWYNSHIKCVSKIRSQAWCRSHVYWCVLCKYSECVLTNSISYASLLYYVTPLCGSYYTLCCLILTHWGRDEMNNISQTTFSTAFSWMKMFEFRLKFHWRLFLWVQLTIFFGNTSDLMLCLCKHWVIHVRELGDLSLTSVIKYWTDWGLVTYAYALVNWVRNVQTPAFMCSRKHSVYVF